MSREKAQKFLTEAIGIDFPYVKMGAIDSLDLFGPTELMILELYDHNHERWKDVLDIGANLGLHSLIMAAHGMQVTAFEPDPEHFVRLLANIHNNGLDDFITAHRAAVHTSSGEAKFIRVLNNLTGNHLEGYKQSYGPRTTITVETVDCRTLWPLADFAKLDCEGNEAELVETTTAEDMTHLSMIMEVRNPENAGRIYQHFERLGVPMWSQKIDWKRVENVEQMPRHNREGSVFVGHRDPWA